eukprot:scaffold12489_cov27-Tisochrysis_lutea.AAC.4
MASFFCLRVAEMMSHCAGAARTEGAGKVRAGGRGSPYSRLEVAVPREAGRKMRCLRSPAP